MHCGPFDPAGAIGRQQYRDSMFLTGPRGVDPRQVRGGDRGPCAEAEGEAGWLSHVQRWRSSVVCWSVCSLVAPLSPPSVLQTKARRQQLPVKEEVLQKQEKHVETVICSLPEDLQAVLLRR